MDTTQPEIKKPFYKKIVKFILWLFICFVLLLGIGVGLVVIYEDEIKASIIKELNKNLNAEVRINPENIDVTLISTFPHCSLLFKNVLMLEATKNKQKDTLLFTKELNLFFNAKNIYDKKYSIKKIKLSQSKVFIKEYKNGTNNYTFWKSSSTNQKNDSLSFQLESILVDDCSFNYSNQQSKIKSQLHFKTIDFAGMFGASNYDLQTNTNFELKYLTQNKKNILKNKNCTANINLQVDNNYYRLKNVVFTLNKMKFDLSGMFNYKDSLTQANINFKGTELDIASVLSLLPDKHKEKINDYNSEGNFYVSGNYNYTNSHNKNLTMNFGIKNSTVNYTPKNISLTELNLQGELLIANNQNYLKLKNISANLLGDKLNGDFELTNFDDPYVKTKLQTEVNLENVNNFWPIDTVKSISGNIKINSNLEGKIEQIKNNIASTNVNLSLDAAIVNLKVLFIKSKDTLSIKTCDLLALDRDITIKNLSFTKGKSDLLINGKMPKLFNYITNKNSELMIEGDLQSNKIYLNDFIETANTSAASSSVQLIPGNIDLKLTTTIKNFYYKKFEATNITGELGIKNKKAILTDLKFNTLQGEATADIFADNTKSEVDIVLQSNFKSINTQQLFTAFENFGQTTLQDKNIKGYITSSLNLKTKLHPNLVLNEKTIEAECDLLINRGELIDFKPLLSLAKFVDISELLRIKFSTLQSKISIANSAITFPKTEINNSALNIISSGTHWFNNNIDYHLQLKISELLAKKNKPNNEFGPIENDKENKRCAFILMTGTIDNPIIKYDRKGLKEKIKTDIKEEKQNLKNILKEEFNFFKKDSTKQTTNKANQHFELQKPNNKSNKKPLEQKQEKVDDDDF